MGIDEAILSELTKISDNNQKSKKYAWTGYKQKIKNPENGRLKRLVKAMLEVQIPKHLIRQKILNEYKIGVSDEEVQNIIQSLDK